MTWRRLRMLLATLVALGIGAPTVSLAAPVITSGSGKAPIRDGASLAARGEALAEALDDALYAACAKLLGVDEADWTTEQQDAIEAKILPARKEYQESFEVLADAAEGDVYRVKVRAVFTEASLKAALLQLEVLQRKRTWQNVMVAIPETHLTRTIPDPAAETAIVKAFTEAGYRVVDPGQVAAIRYNDISSAWERGDMGAVAAIGRKFGAEIVVTGEAFSQAGTEGGRAGMTTCNARVEAKMLRTDTGQIIAADGKHATGIDATEELAAKKALANAGHELALYFMDRMDKVEGAAQKEGAVATVDLVISDIPYAKLAELKAAMKEGLPGVERFNQRGYEKNRAELAVEYSGGDGQALADALAMHRFRSLRLRILKTSPNRIDMSAAPR